MSIVEIIRLLCQCEKCRHEWTTRTPNAPEVCPNCKRTNWNDGGTASKHKTIPKQLEVESEQIIERETIIDEEFK